MNRQPTEFRRLDTHGLAVVWSDGTRQEISSEMLRRNCPCAGCREKRGEGAGHEKPLGGPSIKKSALAIVDSSLEEETKLVSIWPVGQYALGVQWGDGHASGIYTYELLYELGAVR